MLCFLYLCVLGLWLGSYGYIREYNYAGMNEIYEEVTSGCRCTLGGNKIRSTPFYKLKTRKG